MTKPPWWYPDPRGTPGQWYWDGQSLDYAAAEAATQPKKSTIKLPVKVVLVGVAAGAISAKLAGTLLSRIWAACDVGINTAANWWEFCPSRRLG